VKKNLSLLIVIAFIKQFDSIVNQAKIISKLLVMVTSKFSYKIIF